MILPIVRGGPTLLLKLRLRCRSAIAGEPALSGAGDCGDDSGDGVDLPHDVAVALDDVEMTVLIKLDLVWHVQRGINCGASVAGIASFAVAGNGGRAAGRQVQPANSLVVKITEIQGAVWTDDDSIGVSDLGV